MTTIVYPNTLPSPSNFGSISFAPYANNIQTTSVTAGEPNRRKLFAYVPKVMTCSLRITRSQVSDLQTFYSNTCNSTAVFVWKNWLSNSSANQSYAFLEEPTYVYVQDSKDKFDATLKLLVVKTA